MPVATLLLVEETLGSASVIASGKTGTPTRTGAAVRREASASGRFTFGGSGNVPVATG